ncbi:MULTISPECIES: tRNA (adenosine(37)-N6)-threonylcarbamoyltransferase complex ATPase subunit type 1 TsaE [unclassified Roseovarius]|uniref:tRNA (adenosine(37)-N6)-threonylcarbamoyltransferase complex ATPase subunit type 1 TsaE n=1 Tax=unclassified Roseovarius TaxID=2614913 RepID=UPI00273E71F7|nr:MULTISPECIES: tRNA (adenosine(37)-N6)-threonylcarbamoyltransferase complex ATPase subunit type 1 TsaE [unclassified Roseovarius]
MSANTRQLTLDTPEATCDLARALGPHLVPGDTVLLSGGVGAGKTHFARCLILSLLDTPEDVPSPTYTLVQSYDGIAGEIWHADLYRLTDIGEIDELGLTQAFTDAICLVEWPDRLGGYAPRPALSLSLEAPSGDDRRVATLDWEDPRWDDKMRKVLND